MVGKREQGGMGCLIVVKVGISICCCCTLGSALLPPAQSLALFAIQSHKHK